MLHSAGHQRKGDGPNLHSGDVKNPAIMMDGGLKSTFLQQKGKLTPQIWDSKLAGNTPTGKLDNNTGFRARMLQNFGNNTPQDNYDKNKAVNDKKIGPLRADGQY